jgi:AhpD family alkylhydroperoxidase
MPRDITPSIPNPIFHEPVFPAKIREQIALVAAETNGCDYCASAHTALGKHAGLSQDDIIKALEGGAADPKADAAVRRIRAQISLAARTPRRRAHQHGLADGRRNSDRRTIPRCNISRRGSSFPLTRSAVCWIL